MYKRQPIVLVLNRLDQCPEFITHAAYMHSGELKQKFERDDETGFRELSQLLHLTTTELQIPPSDPDTTLPELDNTQPLVQLTNAAIKYGDVVIFDNLDWTINAGEHWQLTGPNGSGKTALLSLITGDHPQCYVCLLYTSPSPRD